MTHVRLDWIVLTGSVDRYAGRRRTARAAPSPRTRSARAIAFRSRKGAFCAGPEATWRLAGWSVLQTCVELWDALF